MYSRKFFIFGYNKPNLLLDSKMGGKFFDKPEYMRLQALVFRCIEKRKKTSVYGRPLTFQGSD
jgi:hypothetical protein